MCARRAPAVPWPIEAAVSAALEALVELAVEPLGFVVGGVWRIDGDLLRPVVLHGADPSSAWSIPGQMGRELLGQAARATVTSVDLDADLDPERAAAARAAGLGFGCALPVDSAPTAILALFGRVAPAPGILERVERAAAKLAPIVARVQRSEPLAQPDVFEALRQSPANLRALLEQSPEPILLLEGDRAAYANAA